MLRRLFSLAALAALLAALATGVLPGDTYPELARAAGAIVAAVALPHALAPRGLQRAHMASALAVAVCAAMLVMADLCLRAPFFDRLLYYRAHEMYDRSDPGHVRSYRYRANVRHRGTCHGDLAAMSGEPRLRRPRDEVFETDALGFRNTDPPAAPDVIVLGDSFVVGIGTTQSRIVGARLRERGVRARALGIPGSPWHEMANFAIALEELAPPPGAVVFWLLYGGNDLDGNPGFCELAPDALPPASRWSELKSAVRLFRARSPVRLLATRALHPTPRRDRVVERAFLDGTPMLFYAPQRTHLDRTLADVRAHANYPCLTRVVDHMRSLAARRKLSLVLVSVPCKEEVYRWVYDGTAPWTSPTGPSAFTQALAELAHARGLPFLDLTGPFVGRARESWERARAVLHWHDDTHWSEEGHALAAELLSGFRR